MIIDEVDKKDKDIESFFNLSREGYMFIKNRMDQYKTNIFETRLLGKKVICISGGEGAKIFYDQERFKKIMHYPNEYKKHYLV